MLSAEACKEVASLAARILDVISGEQIEAKVTGPDGKTSAVVFAFDRHERALVGLRTDSGIFEIDEVAVPCADPEPTFEESYDELMGKKPWESW